jgi:hypothetical protein
VAVNASIQIYGVKAALKELNTIDTKLRRQVTKDYKQIVSSVVADAKAAMPSQAPLSGMDRGWKTKSGFEIIPKDGWSTPTAQKMLAAKINTKKVKEFRGTKVNVGTFRIVWTGTANTIFDIAGRKSSGSFVDRLNAKYGRASRVLWPAYEKNKTQVEQEMIALVEGVMKEVNRNLVMAPASS